MAAGAAAALATLGAAFGNQSRAAPGSSAARQDTSTAAIALAQTPRMARELRKNARDERLLALVTDPQVMGLLVTFAGLIAANRIPWSDDPAKNNAIAGVAAAAAVLMGLGRAGVGDLTTLGVAGAAGLATGIGGGGSGSDFGTFHIGGVPVASIWGPIPSLQWALSKANG